MTNDKNNCQSDQIAAFVDDELKPVDRLAFAEHVIVCDRCATELRAHRTFMRELDTALAGRLDLEVPPDFARYIVPKGSITVDGVSLTINDVTAQGFRVAIIPHTAKLTTLGIKRAGDPVNLEFDLGL